MKFDLNLELALLPPGHAHNLTDHFFALANGLYNRLKQKSRLIGTQTYAECMYIGFYLPSSAMRMTPLACSHGP
jgi:hypothetical protein